jgi:hypothetical protein
MLHIFVIQNVPLSSKILLPKKKDETLFGAAQLELEPDGNPSKQGPCKSEAAERELSIGSFE